jgi:hypothetical protein
LVFSTFHVRNKKLHNNSFILFFFKSIFGSKLFVFRRSCFGYLGIIVKGVCL